MNMFPHVVLSHSESLHHVRFPVQQIGHKLPLIVCLSLGSRMRKIEDEDDFSLTFIQEPSCAI